MIDLHLHTKYSLVDSITEPVDLIKKIKEQNKPAVCVTEHGNLYSSIEMYKLCKENNIKYMHGCEVYICQDVNEKDKNNKYNHLVLISKNETGRLNLIKLVSESSNYKYFGKPRIDFDMLRQHKEGLIVLSACMAGEIQRSLMKNDTEKAKKIAKKYKNEFKEDYYLEFQSHRDETQQGLNRKIVDIAKELDIEYVVTTDAHYINEEDQKYHTVFVGIGQSREVGEIYDDCYIQTDEDVMRICQSTTKEENAIAIKNTYKIMEKCNVEIPLSSPIMPHVVVPSGYSSEIEYLKNICLQGWKKRKIHLKTKEEQLEYKNRLKYEVGIIEKMGFEGYFLLVNSYANSVKRKGIARGSGGGSLTAYLMQIVDTDPIKYGLYFERFIDVGALELLDQGKITKSQLKIPDFDLDFGKEDRDKIMKYITNEYGKENVASLGSFQYIWAKGAIKDIGKVLGISFEETNQMTKKLDDETIQQVLDLGLLEDYVEKYPKLFDYANRLAGLPKSFSMHPCFTKDHLIMTDNGYKKIQDIKIGDKAFTHRGNFQTVKKTMDYSSDDVYEVAIMGSEKIKTTSNHPFFVRKRMMPVRSKKYSDPSWVDVANLSKHDVIGVTINKESVIPNGILPFESNDFWWIVGRYIGDGWTQLCENRGSNRQLKEYRTIICANKNNKETEKIKETMSKLFNCYVTKDVTVNRVVVGNNRDLFEYLNTLGKYAYGKKLTKDILNLPVNLLESFLNGYFSADGHLDKYENQTFKTVSRELAYGIQACIHKVYKRACGIAIINSGMDTIEGRVVNRRTKYMLTFKKHNSKKDHSFYEMGYIWVPLRSIEKIPEEHVVYNITVENDSSYTVNNLTVHNCGKIITTRHVEYYNATEISDSGEYVLQGDMHTADDLGLVKIDVLGLRTIDVIYDVLEMIGKDYEYIAPHNLNFEDKTVLENFKNGNTSGVFQFESSGMKSTLSNIQCSSLYDLSVANALYRPGSMDYIENYAKRRKGEEKYEFLHKDLEEILKDSYGIIVFQEQLIEVGRIAGLSNPDELRQATAKKKDKLMNKIKPELFEGLIKRGWTEEKVEELWVIMLKFAKYSFNKSHSVAYAIIAYICMYLKTYHPHEFIVAWMNSYSGKVAKLLPCATEANRLKINLNIPNWRNASSINYVNNGEVYIGTESIKHVNADISKNFQEIKDNKYETFVDLLVDITENARCNSRQVKILTKLNFFSEFGGNKKLLNIYDVFDDRYKKTHVEKTKAKRIEEVKEFQSTCKEEELLLNEQVESELEYLGYIKTTIPNIPTDYAIITEVDRKYKNPVIYLYRVRDGETEKVKVKLKDFDANHINKFDMIKTIEVSMEGRWKKTEKGGWKQDHNDKEPILKKWSFVNFDK